MGRGGPGGFIIRVRGKGISHSSRYWKDFRTTGLLKWTSKLIVCESWKRLLAEIIMAVLYKCKIQTGPNVVDFLLVFCSSHRPYKQTVNSFDGLVPDYELDFICTLRRLHTAFMVAEWYLELLWAWLSIGFLFELNKYAYTTNVSVHGIWECPSLSTAWGL